MSDSELKALATEAAKLYFMSPSHVKHRRQCVLMGALANHVLADLEACERLAVKDARLASNEFWTSAEFAPWFVAGSCEFRITTPKGSMVFWPLSTIPNGWYCSIKGSLPILFDPLTRGDVRRLLEALGVTLKEGA